MYFSIFQMWLLDREFDLSIAITHSLSCGTTGHAEETRLRRAGCTGQSSEKQKRAGGKKNTSQGVATLTIINTRTEDTREPIPRVPSSWPMK